MAAPREAGTVLCASFAALALGVFTLVLPLPAWAVAALGVGYVGCLAYRPWWAALAAMAAASASAAAVAIDEFDPRPVLGAIAFVCGLVYWLPLLYRWARSPRRWWRRPDASGERPAAPPVAARWRALAGLVCSSALAFGGALVGLAFVAGAAMARRTQPIPLPTMYAALLVLVAVIVLLPGWWVRSYGRIVRRKELNIGWAIVPGVVAVALAGYTLHARDITNARSSSDRAQLRASALGRFDLLLVLDPADPASRRLIEAAKRELQPTDDDPHGDRIAKLLEPRVPDSPYDVAFGLAVAEPPGTGKPLWRLVEPPTQDNRELAESLAEIPLPEDGRPSHGSYGRLLYDAATQQRVRWREGAQRGVAFMLEGLPSQAELDRGAAGVPTPDEDDPKFVCAALGRGGSRIVDGTPRPSKQVTWGEALRRMCAERPQIGVFALTRERDSARLDDWSTWTRAMGGRVHILAPVARLGSDPAVELLQDARDVFTGQPVDNLATVVETFRPHLFMDEREKFAPVDVDWMLYPDARQPSRDANGSIGCGGDGDVETICEEVSAEPDDGHRICDREQFTLNCEPVQARASLAGALDDLIDFAGGAHLGADVVAGDLDPPRMYVHVREEDGTIFLGYWWYFRYNVSPWRTEVNCLPGLGFDGISCHDHEGDWEGVTVVLRPLGRARDPYVLGNLRPVWVLYDAHGRSIWWPWAQVDLAADRGFYATHPVVYVATGSHASYPTGCARAECDQALSKKLSLGEGGFDGAEPWRFNTKSECEKPQLSKDTRGPCLIALPSTDGGRRGVLWNAFPGAWGRARCTIVGKVCSQVDGPRSPSEQKRFKLTDEFRRPRDHPTSSSRPGDSVRLRAMRAAFVKSHPERSYADEPRWPPEPWPVPEGERLPTTAELPG